MKARPIPSGPFAKADVQVHQVMGQVVLALAPATAFGVLAFGWPALWLLLATVLSALAWEVLCLRLAGKLIRLYVFDRSALLSGLLLALSLPPWAPWWIGCFGAFIAIVVGKHCYGGIGQNLFNPAMLARIALLVSFPLEMSTWVQPAPLFAPGSPGLMQSLGIAFGHAGIDAYTGATAIGGMKTAFTQGVMPGDTLAQTFSLLRALIGYTGGSLGETSEVLILAGGLWLMRRGIITWHIPVSLLATVAVLSGCAHLWDGARYPGPLFHLASGGVMLTAFFIATDYVTSPNTRKGQLIFGGGCGLLIYVIRTFGGYPEGAGFAVLLMNAATPLIDHYVRPRIFGRDRHGRPLELESTRHER
jgi:electron transport complex protein RnfD